MNGKRMILALGLSLTVIAQADVGHSFEVAEGEFRLDGKPFVIRCGEIHFARVAPEYWRHRLQMIRACGFNAVTFAIGEAAACYGLGTLLLKLLPRVPVLRVSKRG